MCGQGLLERRLFSLELLGQLGFDRWLDARLGELVGHLECIGDLELDKHLEHVEHVEHSGSYQLQQQLDDRRNDLDGRNVFWLGVFHGDEQ